MTKQTDIPELTIAYAGETQRWTDDAGEWCATVHHDDDSSINDYDADGRVSCYFRHSDRSARPEGFTGRAYKVDVDRSGYVWHEPYGEAMGYQNEPDGEWLSATWENLPDDVRRKEKARIRDLLEGGFVGLELELTRTVSVDGTDYTRTDGASLWSIASLDGEYGREILSNLSADILAAVVAP